MSDRTDDTTDDTTDGASDDPRRAAEEELDRGLADTDDESRTADPYARQSVIQQLTGPEDDDD
jgi:hypothetical protein